MTTAVTATDSSLLAGIGGGLGAGTNALDAGLPLGGSDPAQGTAGTQTPPQQQAPTTQSSDAWKAAGYEAPWLATFAKGKYKTIEQATRGYDEFGTLVNKHAEEASSAQAKAAELAQKLAGVEPLIGAPAAEDGTPKPYEFGWTAPEAVDPAAVAGLEAVLRKHNLSEVVAKDLAPLAETYAAAVAIGQREAEVIGTMIDYGFTMEQIERELTPEVLLDPAKIGATQVGKDTNARLANLCKFWEERAGDNEQLVEAMRAVAARREGIRFLELLRSDLTSIHNGVAGRGVGEQTAEQILKEAAGDRSYFLNDPTAYERLAAARARELAAGKR